MGYFQDYIQHAVENQEAINSKEPTFNNTPLHIAVEESAELTKQLLQAGAATNIKNSFGETPIVSPSIKGDVETFSHLLEAGADMRQTNDADEPISSLTRNETIKNLAEQADILDKRYLHAIKTPNDNSIRKLKKSLSSSDNESWNPYKRLASQIGNDTNSPDIILKTKSRMMLKEITSDPAHKEQMLEAIQEVSARQQNQGNSSLSSLLTQNRNNNQWSGLFNRSSSSINHVQSLEEESLSSQFSR